ncbi:hypothetical protein ON010_g19060 [Phytophthora cinnamomi]|nr:hypothetical protein ON010_g19060 [Phytophthora cinnamomi]
MRGHLELSRTGIGARAADSALEFEMIVDLLPRCASSGKDPSRRGRPKSRGFDLAPEHPLAPHFQAFIRAKFKTPMLGGAPPPALKNGKPSSALRKYLLTLLTPWGACNRSTLIPNMTSRALLQLCEQWNWSTASFANRQCYLYLHNILQKRWRSSANEKTCSEWRSRNADFWNNDEPGLPIGTEVQAPRADNDGPEPQQGNSVSMGADELFELIVAAAAKNHSDVEAVTALRIPDNDATGEEVTTDEVTDSFSGTAADAADRNGVARPIRDVFSIEFIKV